MVYEERNTWVGLVVGVVGIAVYLIIVAPQLATTPAADIDWFWPMVWTIGGSIVLSIVLSILWGIVAGMRDPDGVGRSDVRDREISQLGDRVGQAFLVIAAIGVLWLSAIEADWFWIANATYFGLALSAIVGSVARVVVYRRGLI